jgi:4-amino-4-deoxy-L-arabinose transferase-like glycosyltransferase
VTLASGGALPNAGSKQTSVFLGGIALAVLGQLFLAQAADPWTLFPGLLLMVGSVAVLFYFLPDSLKAKTKSKPLSLSWEITLFGLILLAAFFFRIYRIDSLPAGLHTDQGLTGLCALRILHEGWRPFGEVFDYQVPEILLFYQLAVWFALAGSSYFTFHLFFILLSLAAFPFVYWTVRQWAGSRIALLSLFILAVMRWNWIETRNGYPSIQVPFYLFGALAFWTYWIHHRKKWALLVSAAFVGVGFYSYQAFKIVPFLFLVYAAYEFLSLREKKRSFKTFLPFFLVVLASIFPLLTVMAQKGILGHREADLFIGTKVVQENSLKPLWDVWTGTALMFNRQGDENPRHNIPGHRMLDDVTGILFILGLALAWRHRREREGFYPLAGFGAMLLTGLLSIDPAHSNRLVSLTPFVAFFAGNTLNFFWQSSKTFFKNSKIPAVLLGALLIILTAQNTFTYFDLQANNEECQSAFGLEQNIIGRRIEFIERHFPSLVHFFIDPSFFRNNTVQFLVYPGRHNISEFNLQEWAAGQMPKDKPLACVLLGPQKSGWVNFLDAFFPNLLLLNESIIYERLIEKKRLMETKPWTRGLKGIYWNVKPVTVQRDPVLNFTSKFDFPFTSYPPFRIRWTGMLEAPKTGFYQFQVLTTDNAQLWLYQHPIPMEKAWFLKAGQHPLRLDFEKDSGDNLALTFIWKKPGDDKWEVVPATAFGKLSPP